MFWRCGGFPTKYLVRPKKGVDHKIVATTRFHIRGSAKVENVNMSDVEIKYIFNNLINLQ